ncbi:glycosyltransferase [Planctobacterium marinum]|uniref:Spore protein YkvP/CgeB glycosyl transferase-like domain-containing protein n=1 Tax=Planctobacterium marinum TaxID=1631968 RepID=A0AA48HTN0_9ALTE|nr:hypothetical protein MACH26_32900 [Planctobacterium marinum]
MNRDIKIARIVAAHYPEFIRSIYANNPELKSAPYSEQRDVIKEQEFHQYFGYEDHFRGMGVEAIDIVWDLESLQLQWAKEQGLSLDYDFLTEDKMQVIMSILVEQLRRFKPDVLFVHNARLYEGGFWQYIKERVPSIRWITCTMGFPLRNKMQAYGIDSFLCCVPSFMQEKYSGTVEKELFYYCYDARPQKTHKNIPFSFFGSTGNCGTMHHRTRYEYLLGLTYNADLKVYGKESSKIYTDNQRAVWSDYLKELRNSSDSAKVLSICKEIADKKNPVVPPLAFFNHQAVRAGLFGKAYLDGLADSLVTFNIHTEHAYGDVGNMRMFEATGNGACMMVEHGRNIQHLFEPDTEVVTYRSIGEAVDKAQWLLQNPAKAKEIGAAGYLKTKTHHSFRSRAEQVIEHFNRVLQK